MDIVNSSLLAYWQQQNFTPQQEYVKQGLVLWLDGIRNTRNGHSSTVKKWEDLSGNNYDFTPRNSSKMPTIDADCYTGFTADTFLTCNNADLIAYKEIASVGTLEICVYGAGSTGHIVGFPNISGSTAALSKILIDNASGARMTVAGRYSSATNSRYYIGGLSPGINGGIHSISVIYGGTVSDISLKLDGTTYSTKTGENTGWGNNGGVVTIKNRIHTNQGSTPYPFGGKIYSIRYYDRVLTDDERAHNLMVDQERFGG